MRTCNTLFRCALLGSALAIVSLPAFASDASHEAMKRTLALKGRHAFDKQAKSASASGLRAADATYTVLHSFNGADGEGSGAGVTLDDAGNIYGTTDFGGAHGDGVVFKLTPDGTESVLYAFTGGSDGSAPDGGVIVQPNGTIYGTAGSGGSSGNGTLFQISAKGKFKVLHDFSINDGSFLRGNLVRDKLGNLYGTALFGGASGDGTVFKYGFDGTFTVLHAFNGADGEFPEHGVAMDRDGNLYGVTAFGGTDDNGTVFKITPGGTFSTLHNFTGGDDGSFLYGTVAVGKDGTVYGNAAESGANGHGTVFKIASDGTFTTLYAFKGGADGSDPEGNMAVSGKTLYSTASEGGDPSCQCGGVYKANTKGHESMLHAFEGNDGSGYSAGMTLANQVLYGTAASGGANGDGVVFSVTKK